MKSFQQIRALKENEKEEMYDLLYRSYVQYGAKNPDCKKRDFFKERIESDPYFSLNLNRVLELDGRLVARIGIHDRKMYFQGQILRVGAIGGVCTDPAHRRKGYAKMLLEDCAQYMEKSGFDLSMLFGEPAVYGGSGWQTLSAFGIKTNMRMNATANVRSAWVDEIKEASGILSQIYDQFCACLNGPLLRSKSYWDSWLKNKMSTPGSEPYKLMVVYSTDTPVGYYAFKNRNVILEIGYQIQNKHAFEAVMKSIFSQVDPEEEINFQFFIQEIFDYISENSSAPSLEEIRKQEYYIKKTAIYAGLFKLISNANIALHGVCNTPELLALLRSNNYNFWDLDRF